MMKLQAKKIEERKLKSEINFLRERAQMKDKIIKLTDKLQKEQKKKKKPKKGSDKEDE